ncbi:MAG: hypothetical protein CRN43_14145 [Candidatus Nephrothrix sp. EaCA]|nr:MAG: hypothetical protein CRN43_14145 [Candidatus Nephrothrix sp. EaCA]
MNTYTAAITAYDAASNPYGIYTVAHLNDVRNNKAGSYKMMNNITLPARNAAGALAAGISDYADKGWLPIAHDASPDTNVAINAFTGKFDGGNFSVDNFYINRNAAGDYYAGLFGRTSGAVISNTGITGSASPAVTGSRFVGALAGYIQGGSVTNCYAHVTVRCESNNAYITAFAGGLLGALRGASLSASYSSGNVSGNHLPANATLYIGGLAGALLEGTANIRNCFSTGNINIEASGAIYGGGLAGALLVSIANCYATGNVTFTAQSAQSINLGALGGLIGNVAAYTNCYRNSNAAITSGGQPATLRDASVSTPKTKAEMQTDAFKGNLNGTSGTAWGRDGGKNDGLPYIIGVGVGR